MSNIDRRRFLQFSTLAASSSVISLKSQSVQASPKTKTSARIVIAGAGAAGLTAANLLNDRLEGAEITLLDARKAHYYQPGFTLIAAGLKPTSYVETTTAEYVPKDVELMTQPVVGFIPEGNKIITKDGIPIGEIAHAL